eukprot:361839-Chlamydomonas_euryale.AAC.10
MTRRTCIRGERSGAPAEHAARRVLPGYGGVRRHVHLWSKAATQPKEVTRRITRLVVIARTVLVDFSSQPKQFMAAKMDALTNVYGLQITAPPGVRPQSRPEVHGTSNYT